MTYDPYLFPPPDLFLPVLLDYPLHLSGLQLPELGAVDPAMLIHLLLSHLETHKTEKSI
jgi:hypothetical protein